MGFGLCLVGLLTASIRADTFQLTDGQSLTGDIISFNESGMVLLLGDGKYSERIPWGKLSQDDLKALKAKPRLAPLVDPFIEIPLKVRVKKTEVVIKPVERLERPAAGSFFGALVSSSVGLVSLLLIYLANLYAAYEISMVRAYPPALVCGIAAVAPFIGPIVFLCLPTRIVSAEEWKPGQPRVTAPAVAQPAEAAAATADGATAYPPPESAAAASVLPQTQVFQRGKFTFNRRFIETKFGGLFGMVRRDPEKDMVMVFKTARGEYVASRITRIAPNDMHVEIRKGAATQEVPISFLDIQEIQLKHKDA